MQGAIITYSIFWKLLRNDSPCGSTFEQDYNLPRYLPAIIHWVTSITKRFLINLPPWGFLKSLAPHLDSATTAPQKETSRYKVLSNCTTNNCTSTNRRQQTSNSKSTQPLYRAILNERRYVQERLTLTFDLTQCPCARSWCLLSPSTSVEVGDSARLM